MKDTMKRFLMSAALAAAAAVCLGAAQGAEVCAKPDPAQLRNTWQSFRTATLKGQAEDVAKFYRFPLKLLTPYDGDKPRMLTRPVFLKHYEALFRRNLGDDTEDLLTQMKKTTGQEFIEDRAFDEKRCAYVGQTRIQDYYFLYGRLQFGKKQYVLLDRLGCSFISGLVAADISLRALMESADSRLIS